MDVVAVLAMHHARLLRLINESTDAYFQGLAPAARAHRNTFGAGITKRLTCLDVAFHVARHADIVVLEHLCCEVQESLCSALSRRVGGPVAKQRDPWMARELWSAAAEKAIGRTSSPTTIADNDVDDHMGIISDFLYGAASTNIETGTTLEETSSGGDTKDYGMKSSDDELAHNFLCGAASARRATGTPKVVDISGSDGTSGSMVQGSGCAQALAEACGGSGGGAIAERGVQTQVSMGTHAKVTCVGEIDRDMGVNRNAFEARCSEGRARYGDDMVVGGVGMVSMRTLVTLGGMGCIRQSVVGVGIGDIGGMGGSSMGGDGVAGRFHGIFVVNRCAEHRTRVAEIKLLCTSLLRDMRYELLVAEAGDYVSDLSSFVEGFARQIAADEGKNMYDRLGSALQEGINEHEVFHVITNGCIPRDLIGHDGVD